MQNQISQISHLSAKDLRSYFYEPPIIAIYLVACGITCFIIYGLVFLVLESSPALASFSYFFYLGMLCFAIGEGIILHGRSQGPTDAEYENWQMVQRDMLLNVALKKLNLAAQYNQGIIKPVPISGVVFKTDESYTYLDIREKFGKDKRLHHSVHLHAFLFFTKDRLAIFVSDSDALNPTEHLQEVHSYYYTHIIGLSLRQSQKAFSGKLLSKIGLRAKILRRMPGLWRMYGLTLKFQKLLIEVDNGNKIELEVGLGLEVFDAKGKRLFVDVDDFGRFEQTFNELTWLLHNYKQASSPIRP